MAGELKRLLDVAFMAGGTVLVDKFDLLTAMLLIERAHEIIDKGSRGGVVAVGRWLDDYKAAKGE